MKSLVGTTFVTHGGSVVTITEDGLVGAAWWVGPNKGIQTWYDAHMATPPVNGIRDMTGKWKGSDNKSKTIREANQRLKDMR